MRTLRHLPSSQDLDVISGERIAHALIAVYRRICVLERHTAEHYACDAAGDALTTLAEVKDRAARVSVLGALELATDDVDLHAAACHALRRACDQAGVRASLSWLDARVEHQQLLALVDAAIRHARTLEWSASQRPCCPVGAPSEQEYRDLCLEHQLIEEIHFGTARDLAGQFEGTWSMNDALEARAGKIAAYFARHEVEVRDIEAALDRRERAEWRAHRRRLLISRVRTPIRRRHQQIASRVRRLRRDRDAIPF
jgi:hypothetical protein